MSIVGSVISAAGDLVSGYFNRKSNENINQQNVEFQREANAQNIEFQRETNAQNIAFQKEVNAQQEQLQREQWAREDNAAQRRAADLQAAGLNKNLAAGSAASSTLSTRLSSAQAVAPKVNAVNAGNPSRYDEIAQSFNLYNTYLQNKYLKEQVKGQQAANANTNADTAYKNVLTENEAKKSGFIGDDMASKIALNGAMATLYQVEGQWKAKSAQADIDLINARINDLDTNAQYTLAKLAESQANLEKISAEVAESVARTNLLSVQGEKALQDIVMSMVEQKVAEYNLQKSVDDGIRTTDNSSVTSTGKDEAKKDRFSRVGSAAVGAGVGSIVGALIGAGGANKAKRKFYGNWSSHDIR